MRETADAAGVPATPGPIVRQRPLSDQVADALRSEILGRGMRPGDRLPSERELGERFGVSRTVIREAVRTLTARGLVAPVPGSGLTVGTTTLEDVSEMLRLFVQHGPQLQYLHLHEVRATLEVAVAGLAAERITPEALTELHDLCDQLPRHADDIVEASRNDYLFHRQLALATDNDFYVMLYDVLGEALMETRVATFSFAPARISVVTEAHRAIVAGLAAGQQTRAQDAMLAHLEEVKETWLRLSDQSSEASATDKQA